MLAPIIPFTTEEIYQTYFKKCKSIHLTSFPKYETSNDKLEKEGDNMIKYLELARKEKSEKGLSQKAEIENFEIENNIPNFEKTVTGRLESGILIEINPSYMHTYGKFVPEILKIDQ